MQFPQLKRRDFLPLLGGAVAWPISAASQQPAVPVIGVLAASPAVVDQRRMIAFHRGLGESGYIDGRNLAISYLQAEGQYDRLTELATESAAG